MSIRQPHITSCFAILAVCFGVCPSLAHGQALTPSNLFISAPHSVYENKIATGDTVSAAFSTLTNGVVEHLIGVNDTGGAVLIDNVDTWNSDNLGLVNDFVGLKYDAPFQFNSINIELGNQFSNGGDWEAMPKLYILKNPTLIGSTVQPALVPSAWKEVSGLVETSGHVFSPTVVPGAGGTIHFDLSSIPAADRTGYGWVIGGVDGNQNASNVINFVSCTEVSATGISAPAPAIAQPTTPQPVNFVSNSYHNAYNAGDLLSSVRGQMFAQATNGVIEHGGSAQKDGFDTWQNDTTGELTDFVGLQYNTQVKFDTIKVDLGQQFANGGDWDSMPRIFILKNAVDTDTTRPESDPTNWQEITGYSETTGHLFSPYVTAGAGGSMIFDLSAIPANERTGWGFAVGGVDGNGNLAGVVNFISVTELSITGSVVVTGPVPGDFNSDGNVDGADLAVWQQHFNTTSGGTLATGDADGDGDVDGADFIVWQTHYPYSSSATVAVPEPTSLVISLIAACFAFLWRRSLAR